ncbi:hypothetical protein ABZ553_14855 [Streptomyces sparsogenes]|uniref:hypothetical protein n=1 Tax=Streptomyces sparsogenes TaxID=67365 RepID=UPI0033FD9E90
MPDTPTNRLGLYKSLSDGSELVDYTQDLGQNWDKIDVAVGFQACASTTRPSTPYSGKPIRETDTARTYVHNGSSPASGGWVQIPNSSSTFNGDLDLTSGRQLNIGSSTSDASLAVLAAANNTSLISGRVGSDTVSRYLVDADGTTRWGPGGSGAADVTVARSGTATLALTGSLTVSSALTVAGNINSASNLTMGAWTTYTPTWTAATTNPGLGNGTLVGRYAVIGKTCHAQINLMAGSTTTFGSGTYSFALPFTSANQGCTYIGNAHLLQSSRWGGHFVISPNAGTASAYFPNVDATTTTLTAWSPTTPITFASGGVMRITVTYEIA